MKNLHKLLLLLLVVAFPASAQYTTVTATVTDPSGVPYANSKVVTNFIPSPSATELSRFIGSPQGAPQFPSTATAYTDGFGTFTVDLADNNQITPSGSKWSFNTCYKTGVPCFSLQVTVTGASQSLSATLSAAAPLINPAPSSTFASIIVTGLAAIGGLTTPMTGSAPMQIGSVWYPGTATGLASAPSTQPGFSVVLSGGSIADGTYYCKVTYWNQNGETTGSPTRTITVTGGGGAAKINIGPGDAFWLTGAPGYRTYCSNDNVTFYRQTPNPVVADFMIDSFTHYNTMGSFGARLTSLTFSGTQIPTTNTATITPLQVALNATRRAPTGVSAPVPVGTLFVPAIDGTVNPSGQFSLTTPLIAMKGDSIIGSGAQNGLVNRQTRIFDNTTWNNTKLAVVMVFGGDAHISNLGIQGVSTNALMILGGAGYQGGTDGGMSVSDVALRAAGSASVYRALVMVGIQYHSFFNNISVGVTGNYVVEWRNSAGGEHYFQGGRWDTSGAGIMKSVPGWTDPDNGVHDAGFPFGVSGVTLKNILTEGGTGIMWDCVGLGMIFDFVQGADAPIAPGTDSLAKFGTDATYGGATGITLINTSFGTTTNARVGTNLVGGQQVIRAFGNSHFGWGSSTGNQQTVDFNNVANMIVYDYAGAIGSIDPAAAATTPHPVNLNDNTFFYGLFGDAGGGTNVVTVNAILGRLEFHLKSGNNATRGTRASLVNTGTALEMRASDDASYIWSAPVGTALSNLEAQVTKFRGYVRVGTGGGTPQLFIGPSTATPALGSTNFGLANSFSIGWQNAAGNATILGWRVNASDEMESLAPLGIMPLANATPLGKAGKIWNGAFGTGSFTGQVTSTLATGTAPFSIASTTVVPNLNVSQLLGKTWAIPDPIGATTPGTGAFTTVNIGTGTTITKVLSATATLDFANQAAIGCNDLTITVTGAALGDTVSIGAPNASVPSATSYFFGWVSAADTVTVRFCTLVSGDPASGTFRATVTKF